MLPYIIMDVPILQPYKRFVQVAYNCGTPLIRILHAQNGYIKSYIFSEVVPGNNPNLNGQIPT